MQARKGGWRRFHARVKGQHSHGFSLDAVVAVDGIDGLLDHGDGDGDGDGDPAVERSGDEEDR